MVEAVARKVEDLERQDSLAAYRTDPCAYAENVLHVHWTDAQQHIARLLLTPPYRVLVKASHNVGKSFLAAGLVNWWYDTFSPSAVITTAPTREHVKSILWREIRRQRRAAGLGGFPGPKDAILGDVNSDHFALGLSCESGEAYQGRHLPYMLFIMDESVGVDAVFWEATKSMWQPVAGHAWLAIHNPTDTSSQAYQEEMGDGWHVVTMSALDHPNIRATLAGQMPPYPGAVSMAQFQEWIRDWTTPIQPEERRSTDISWPPRVCPCCQGRGEVDE